MADYAMQVMGGAGYCREYTVERLWRDAKLLEVIIVFRSLLSIDIAFDIRDSFFLNNLCFNSL